MCLAVLGGSAAAAAEPRAAERVRWFSEAKLGMFMHWGLYAHAAGVWKEMFETKDTGDKDYHFQPHRIGVIAIPAGAGELSVHPVGAEDVFLKLRSVRLIPFE